MDKHCVACPGCGTQLYSENGSLDEGLNASAACRELMFQLSYYTLTLRDSHFIHQLAVDAFAAQHSGKQTKPITTAFALVGLYLANERNFTGKQVQQAHLALAKRSKTWPCFTAPQEKARWTVRDVTESPDDQKQSMIKKWSRSVWEIWEPERTRVAGLVKDFLNV
jgi:hypothetical protein